MPCYSMDMQWLALAAVMDTQCMTCSDTQRDMRCSVLTLRELDRITQCEEFLIQFGTRLTCFLRS